MEHLSKSQQLIFETEKYAGGAVNVICGAMLTRSEKEITAMKTAVNKLFHLHDILRTHILEVDGEVYQTIADYEPQEVKVLQFENKEKLDQYADLYAKVPFDFHGSLCEIQIVLLKDCSGILVKLHHIVGDAWALALIGIQFNALLNKEVPTVYAYKEHLVKEDEYLRGEGYIKDKAFFLEQFRNGEDVTYLSETQNISFEATRKTFEIAPEQAKQIYKYGKDNGVSPFAMFLTVFAIYMSRVRQNAEKFYIGTAFLNRFGVRDKNTLGMFVNTVPLLMELDYEKTFSENLSIIKTKVFSALRHQRCSYSDTLTAIRQEYHFKEKLYDVMLSYQNATIVGAEEVESTWYHCGAQMESLQIHIDDRDQKGVFCIHYDYQTEKFTTGQIEHMHENLIILLFDGIKSDRKKLWELELLSTIEKQKLLCDFNDTTVDYPRDQCVHEIFEEKVQMTPDKVALIFEEKSFSYRELDEMSNALACYLRQQGIQRNDVIPIIAKRSWHIFVAMLGILKAGAAYMPVDIDYPLERVQNMLNIAKVKMALTYGYNRVLPVKMVSLETFDYDKDNDALSNINTPRDLCYVIFTSGSTGAPKGVSVCHQNVVNFCANNNYNTCQTVMKNMCQGIVSVTNFVFDIFVTESLLPLLRGIVVYLANDEQIISQNKLSELVMTYSIDVIQTTPTKMRGYISNKRNLQYIRKFKVIILGGEELPSNLYEELSHCTDSYIFNIYGPSEATVWSSCTLIKNCDISIGKPIANTQIYIVDKYLCPVPMGVTGELCIAGDGVGVGYLNRPELTAEKFIDNPFGKGKLYKTGDLAYWREDGNVVYVGRNDFQAKIRGLRIELGEIENIISDVDNVSQSAVVVRKDDKGHQFICAFYTFSVFEDEVDTEEENTIERKVFTEIRQTIAAKLPRYMMPHSFTRLKMMPMTSSGKIDRKALPEIDLHKCNTKIKYIEAETEQEKILVTAVEVVLEIEKISMLDNFIDQGGDSLKAIELIAELEKTGYYVGVKEIFAADTLRSLAKKIRTSDDTIEIGEKQSKYLKAVPATPAQMRIYTAQSMSGGITYNVPYAFRVKNLDPVKLQYSVSELVKRHDILRVSFDNREGQIFQVIDDNAGCKVEVLENADIATFIRPFDLNRAPLLRVGYYEDTVIIDMHHIITDGSSISIFLRELNEIYMERNFTEMPVQYREFAMKKKGDTLSGQYWLSIFKEEPPVLELNTDFPRKKGRTFNGSVLYRTLSLSMHKKICEKCRELNITPYVFYMGAFHILLSKFSGNEDIAVGTPVSGRNGRFLNTIGMFVNTVVLRSRPEGTKTVKDFLKEVSRSILGALEHQDYPYGELVKKLNIHIENRNPLFDVMFVYQSEKMTDVILGDEVAELLEIPITTSKYDFTYTIMPLKSKVVLMVEYCTDLYREKTVLRIMEGYNQILYQMMEEDKILWQISAVTELEQQKILHHFNNTVADYPEDKCVHEIFEEQVEKTPDKVALVFGNSKFSYATLNAMSNGLAWNLRKKGVCRGDIVGILAKRSYEIVVAILGILKSGAAYLPIDCNYPQSRIDLIVKDSQCKIVMVHDVDYISACTMNLSDNIVYNEQNLPNLNSALDTCGVIYTSGSTGMPKGALLKHRGLVNFSYANNILYKNGSCVIGFSIYTFDAFFLDTISPLLRGITAVMSTEEEQFKQIEFEKVIKQNPNCNMFITPSKFKFFLGNCKDKYFYENIHNICFGGEEFPPEFVGIFPKRVNVFNIYGPTECSMWAVSHPVENQDIALGKPIANTQIYIVDKYLCPVPIGVTGELCIAGDGVGAGYLNRPKLTAEKFVANPFGEGKLYKTGDLAYWREDGNIVYVGRNDFQVKIRGLRVELGEIENAMSGVDGILQSAVVVRKDNAGRQFICAFYTLTESEDVVESGKRDIHKNDVLTKIKQTISNKLPRYMMPHIFTQLSKMPMTPSGKIDRKALPKVDLHSYTPETEYSRPESGLEKRLVSIMERVLEYAPIGRKDDFFSLGGDSLKAIEFVSKAHNAGIYFNLQNVFDCPTVEMLGACIINGDQSVRPCSKILESDFREINQILAKNTGDDCTIPHVREVGNILLAGATGFLGIHMLAEYLEHDSGIAYCIVRGINQKVSEQRLKDLFTFYFGNKYKDVFCTDNVQKSVSGGRIVVLCGDLQKKYLGLTEQQYGELTKNVDMVINAAASVKHYGAYQYFYESNVETIQHLITFCRFADARLVHISTLSVSGNSFGDDFDGYVSETEKHFYESSLYIGQPLENVYARSKFEAEKAVLGAMAEGLKANIMRMGNLTNRFSDGVFQKNHESNATLQRIKGILDLGVIPDYLMNIYVEFTPIDEAAKAVMTIARHFSVDQTVFHINSTKVLYMESLQKYFAELGYSLQTVGNSEFTAALRKTAESSGRKYIFETFINDMDDNDRIVYESNIYIENCFTERYLRRLGFEWSEIGIDYLRKYTVYFEKIGYFNKKSGGRGKNEKL